MEGTGSLRCLPSIFIQGRAVFRKSRKRIIVYHFSTNFQIYCAYLPSKGSLNKKLRSWEYLSHINITSMFHVHSTKLEIDSNQKERHGMEWNFSCNASTFVTFNFNFLHTMATFDKDIFHLFTCLLCPPPQFDSDGSPKETKCIILATKLPRFLFFYSSESSF